jgi:hypothetical protein
MNKQPEYILLRDVIDGGVNNSSDTGAVDSIQNLHSVVEAISGADGVQITVSGMTFHFRLESESGYFACLPVIVQTIGSFSDSANLSSNRVSQLLDSAIDDVFGYHPLLPSFKAARKMPNVTNNGYALEFSVQLPQHLRNLLNKETETERLQNLYLGMVYQTETSTFVLDARTWIEVRYSEKRKKIVIR